MARAPGSVAPEAPMANPPMATPAHGIRPLGVADIPALLALARDVIPDTMAARLGPRFADQYHRALLDEPELKLDGYFIGEELQGFIVYSHDVREALRSAFRRHVLTFAAALVRTLLSPHRIAYILRIAGSILARTPEPGMDVPAELLTIAVRRGARGGGDLRKSLGINVPHALIERAIAHVRARGAAEVKVFCKPLEMDPAANGFVRKEGFELRGEVIRWGIVTNLYVKRLSPSGAPPASEAAT